MLEQGIAILKSTFLRYNQRLAMLQENLGYVSYVINYNSGQFDDCFLILREACAARSTVFESNHPIASICHRVLALVLEEMGIDNERNMPSEAVCVSLFPLGVLARALSLFCVSTHCSCSHTWLTSHCTCSTRCLQKQSSSIGSASTAPSPCLVRTCPLSFHPFLKYLFLFPAFFEQATSHHCIHLSIHSGENSLTTAKYYSNLGRLYQTKEQYEQSEQYHRRALEVKKDILGATHHQVCYMCISTSLCLDCHAHIMLCPAALFPPHPPRAQYALSLGHLAALLAYNLQGREREAMELYRASIDIAIHQFGPAFSGVMTSSVSDVGVLMLFGW